MPRNPAIPADKRQLCVELSWIGYPVAYVANRLGVPLPAVKAFRLTPEFHARMEAHGKAKLARANA